MMSTMGVIDSTLKMSCCAGIANQIKFGIIIKKKSANPKISKPNLYFFKTRLPLQTYNFSFYPTTLTNCKFFKSSISVQRLINHLLSNLEIISQYCHFSRMASAPHFLYVGVLFYRRSYRTNYHSHMQSSPYPHCSLIFFRCRIFGRMFHILLCKPLLN